MDLKVGDKVIDKSWMDRIAIVKSINEDINLVQLEDQETGGIGYTAIGNVEKVGDFVEAAREVTRQHLEGAAARLDKIAFGDATISHEEAWEDLEQPQKFDTGESLPVKFDNNKPRLDLIRPEFILALGKVLAYGAEKYSEPVGETPNYLKGEGFNYSRIIGSLERHIQQFKMGVDVDEESGEPHLAAAAANIMFLLTYQLTGNGLDDRVVLTKGCGDGKAEKSCCKRSKGRGTTES